MPCAGRPGNRFGAGRGDNTVIEHPTKPGVFRFFTLTELRRLFGLPASFILPQAKTSAGEILGQGVIITLFKKIIKCATSRVQGEECRRSHPRDADAHACEQLALAF